MIGRILVASGLTLASAAGFARADTPDATAVLATYADIAAAGYADSLATAKELDTAIDKLIDAPSEASLKAARQAWLAARVPYQQTEVYRFGNPIVDEWEGRVNAWPLDEGLIDYVAGGYGSESDENAFYTADIIANPQTSVGGVAIDAEKITPELISTTLHEVGGVEANVASGYHAIEFLLWGQDLNGTDAGAGERPWTDFSTENCTGGNCERRAEYLKAASELLVSDLQEMAENWQEGGEARTGLLEGDPKEGLVAIFTGMGSLSYGELAGERMKLGLILHDPEEEHDCFSDNTHNSHYYDAKGVRNVYLGRYEGPDGKVVEGPSPADLVKAAAPEVHEELVKRLDETMAAMQRMKDRAEGGEAYDQMIGEGNDEGNAVVQAAIDGLVAQTQSIERAIAALDLGSISLEGSDSLDNPDAVFQ
ncbi:imelysin family protein [Afifella sp. IM 167]|uniref:imelysin family protein n=1 Tax=Afifella sp. IM 167 TaxID=2033586 RepID=UPI001CCD71BB|nr:imelysin family protein [Afifella sp. IM 167]MBZ8135319.1 peptidase [Afifella sp. IM 167]